MYFYESRRTNLELTVLSFSSVRYVCVRFNKLSTGFNYGERVPRSVQQDMVECVHVFNKGVFSAFFENPH